MNSAAHSLSKSPLVSVSIITFNHKDFIADAIESVLKQEVDFEYEIIVGDDFSSDGTQEIIKSYQKKHPDKIQLILHPRDYDCIPGRINNITNLYACRGKYIAMLDGDDSWLSTDKLQKQVDFLEKNADFSLTFTETLLYFQDGTIKPYSERLPNFNNGKTAFTHTDVLSGWFIQTSSMLFTNFIEEFPAWFWEVYSADYAIQLLATQHGKAKFFPEITCRRNYHTNSFSVTQNKTRAQRERRKREQSIFGTNFPGYSEYQNYFFAKKKLSAARRNLKKIKFGPFFLELAKGFVYSGRFLKSGHISHSEKMEIFKKDFSKKLKK